jgi:outer membrane protein TolC
MILMKSLFLCFVILIIGSLASPAQKFLSADSAAAIALKNSFDIRIARTSADISKRNNTAGNAGMLPEAGITGSDTWSLGNVQQHYSDGSSVSKTNANSNSMSAGIALNWTLFDGGKMFVTKRKLNEIETLGEILFRTQVMQTLSDVFSGYFNVVRQKEQLQAIRVVIRFNQERVEILQASFNAGLAPKTDLLQAQIDLNVYKENAISQQVVVLAAHRQLNQLLSRDAEEPYEVADTIIVNYQPDKKELAQKLFSANPLVLSSQKQVEIARLGVSEFKALQLPSVNFSAGYDFLHSDNATGTIRMNDSYGPQAGATLSIPLYQAGNIRRQIAVGRLQLESARISFESTKLQVNTQLQLALTDFDTQVQLLQIEEKNYGLARENLTISIQRLRLGQTTALEVRQAQESFQESLTRLTNFGYASKIAEIKLKQLMAAL